MSDRPLVSQPGRTRRFAATLIPAGLLLALVATGCSRTSAAPARRGGDGAAVPVVTAKAGTKDVPIELSAIGNVEAYETITIQSQITGQLTNVFFHEGDFVKKGAPLFTIDRRPFEAALAQAQANQIRDEALLAQAEAQLSKDAAQAEYSQITAERNAQLVARGIVSKDIAQQSQAGADATAAVVKADKAAIESARAQLVAQRAAVDNAKLQLGYTSIASPIDGRTGNLQVKAGNLVTANSSQLITIQQIQPVYVTFTVPAVHLPSIKRRMAEEQLDVIATPQDSDAQPASGALTFIDNVVDTATDTIKLKGTFTNPDRRLWPGQFARVRLRLETLPQATIVPGQAVQTGQDGQYVFVVKPDSTVEQRVITTGARIDQDIVVQKGVKPGETIVTEGQLRLEPGSRVAQRDPRAGAPGGGAGDSRRGGQGQGAEGRQGGRRGPQ